MKPFRTKQKSQPSAAHWSGRRWLALFCVMVGVAGCILPIIPGLPFFVVAARLLGPRDRHLRMSIMLGRRLLRWLRGARLPLLRRLGARLTPYWHTFTKLMLGAQ